VAPDFTHDRRHRERHEVRPGVHIEPDHRVHQPHPGDLDQVVAGFAAAVEPACDVVRQRQASLHDAVALAGELCGVFRHPLQFAEHVGDIRVFRVRPC
jgi:hypothetical protein